MVLGKANSLFLIQTGVVTNLCVTHGTIEGASFSVALIFRRNCLHFIISRIHFCIHNMNTQQREIHFDCKQLLPSDQRMYCKYFNKCSSSSSFSPKTLTKLMRDWEIYSYVKKFPVSTPRQQAVPFHKHVHHMTPVKV